MLLSVSLLRAYLRAAARNSSQSCFSYSNFSVVVAFCLSVITEIHSATLSIFMMAQPNRRCETEPKIRAVMSPDHASVDTLQLTMHLRCPRADGNGLSRRADVISYAGAPVEAGSTTNRSRARQLCPRCSEFQTRPRHRRSQKHS